MQDNYITIRQFLLLAADLGFTTIKYETVLRWIRGGKVPFRDAKSEHGKRTYRVETERALNYLRFGYNQKRGGGQPDPVAARIRSMQIADNITTAELRAAHEKREARNAVIRVRIAQNPYLVGIRRKGGK